MVVITDILVSARRGGGAPADILFGTVTFRPTLAHSRAASIVLPAPTTFDLVNGEVVATNIQPTPEPVGGKLEWGYEVTFKDRYCKTYSFLVGVPDTTTRVNFTELPRYFETEPPLFGQGPKGEPGEAATITVGSVTSGTTPSVNNSGTSSGAVLDFVLPKGDKGDTGAGVPAGGSALQYVRKNAGNTTTEWATLNKSTVGLGNVDNTSDLNKPVSLAQQAAIDGLVITGDGRWVKKSELDQQVATNIASQDSYTYDALGKATDTFLQPVKQASDPLAYLDNVKIFAQFPVRESGEFAWVQGFSIDKSSNYYYVSNQQGSNLRFDRRVIGTNNRNLTRNITTEDNAFTESLDWFRDTSGDLIFVVWPKAMSFPGAYALYNLTKNTLGPQIPINGLVRGSRYGDIFVTTDTWGNNSPSKFYIYSWESIKSSSPVLLQTINCKNYGATAAKTQGIAYNGGYIFFAQGAQDENMTISVYNSLGTLETVRNYSRASLMKALNNLSPGMLTNPNYTYECEGAYHVDGKLYTLQIVNNNPSVTSDAVAVILEHNNIDGAKLESDPPTKGLITEWVNVDLESGWSHHTTMPLQVRVNEDKVEIQGYAINASFVGGFTTMGNLPANFPRPSIHTTFAVPGNTPSIRALQFYAGGSIAAYASTATGAWYGVNGGSTYSYK